MIVLLLVLSGLAALRTRRLILEDDLGYYPRLLFFRATDALAGPGSLMQPPSYPRRAWLAGKLEEGFFCTWCFPFWLVAAFLGTGLAWGDGWAWQLLTGSLAVSYVVGHVADRLDTSEE